jgi:hypothetical protein
VMLMKRRGRDHVDAARVQPVNRGVGPICGHYAIEYTGAGK